MIVAAGQAVAAGFPPAADELPPLMEEADCPACCGAGRLRGRRVTVWTCPECEGSGRVLVDSPAGRIVRHAVAVAAERVIREREAIRARSVGWWTAAYVADYLSGNLTIDPPEEVRRGG